MIPVKRGPEPPELANIRSQALVKVRDLAARGQPITQADIPSTYKKMAKPLIEQQHYKCCYCEHSITESYNDVEHYRPKARAVRLPGSKETHGYWWLAYTWENLLFSCPSCNRSAKNDLFPLTLGDTPLLPEASPPGQEHPLFLDPAGAIHPAEHLEFVPSNDASGEKIWRIEALGGSSIGTETIRVLEKGLEQARPLWDKHVKHTVQPMVSELRKAIQAGSKLEIRRAFARAKGLLHPALDFTLLTYDVLTKQVPAKELARVGLQWPKRTDLGR